MWGLRYPLGELGPASSVCGNTTGRCRWELIEKQDLLKVKRLFTLKHECRKLVREGGSHPGCNCPFYRLFGCLWQGPSDGSLKRQGWTGLPRMQPGLQCLMWSEVYLHGGRHVCQILSLLNQAALGFLWATWLGCWQFLVSYPSLVPYMGHIRFVESCPLCTHFKNKIVHCL